MLRILPFLASAALLVAFPQVAEAQQNPLAAARNQADDPLSGTYTDDLLELTLKREADVDGFYIGEIVMQGQRFPVEAWAEGNDLEGTFSAGEDEFPFTAKIGEVGMTFTTDGTTFVLQKRRPIPAKPSPTSQAPSNPLTERRAASTPAVAATAPVAAGSWQLKDYGFSANPPADFRPNDMGGGTWLLGSNTIPGMIMVVPSPGMTEQDVRTAAQTGLQDQGVSLMPQGGLQERASGGGKVFTMPVQGFFQGSQVQGISAATLQPGGQALLILALTTPDHWSNLQPHAEAFVKSISLATAEQSPYQARWMEGLAGQQLVQMSSDYSTGGLGSSGHSSEKYLDLCADGQFSYRSSSSFSASVDGGSAFGSDGDSGAGHWQLAPGSTQLQATLVLSWEDGTTSQHLLGYDGKNLTVDGEKTYRQPAENCL